MKDESKKLYDNQQVKSVQMNESRLNAYLSYLTRGVIQSKLLFKFAINLKNKLKQDMFDKFNSRNDHLIDYLIEELLEKIAFKQVCQESRTCNMTEEKKKEAIAAFTYFHICEKTGSLALPIFQKIFEKQLTLIEYQLN